MNSVASFHAKMDELGGFFSDEKIYLNQGQICVKGTNHAVARFLGLDKLPCFSDDTPPYSSTQDIAQAAFRLIDPHQYNVTPSDGAALANLRRFFVAKHSRNPEVQKTIALIDSCLLPSRPLPADLIRTIALKDPSNDVFCNLRLVATSFKRALDLTVLKESAILAASIQGHARSIAGLARLLKSSVANGKLDEAKALFRHFSSQAPKAAIQEFMRIAQYHGWLSDLLWVMKEHLEETRELELDLSSSKTPLSGMADFLSHHKNISSLKLSSATFKPADSSHLKVIGKLEKLESLDLSPLFNLDFHEFAYSLNLNGMKSLALGVRFKQPRLWQDNLHLPLTIEQQSLLNNFQIFYEQFIRNDFRDLESLSLFGVNQGIDLTRMPWEAMPNLKHLLIYGLTTPQEVVLALKGLPLESLHIQTTHAHPALFELRGLKRLHIEAVGFATTLHQLTERLEALTNLESLSLRTSGINIDDIGPHFRTILQKCPQLQSLSLPSAKRLSIQEATAMQPLLQQNRSMEALCLLIRDPPGKEFYKALLQLPTLKRLILRNLDDDFAKASCELPQTPNLEALKFASNFLGKPPDCRSLSSLKKLKQLLLPTMPSDSELEGLLALTELETLILYGLDVNGARISDVGLEQVIRLPKLSTLEISGHHHLTKEAALHLLRNKTQIKHFRCFMPFFPQATLWQAFTAHFRSADEVSDPLEIDLLSSPSKEPKPCASNHFIGYF